jgi:hypothetical protein
MALAYNLWSEEDIKNRNIVPDGDYPFEIIALTKKKTKAGKDKNGIDKTIYDMLEIDFSFWDANGTVRKQRDWFVFMEGMDWKLRHLANTTDTLEFYESHELDTHHLLHKKGIFNLGSKEMIGSDGLTRKVNFVKDYVKKELSKQDQSFLDDDVPMF